MNIFLIFYCHKQRIQLQAYNARLNELRQAIKMRNKLIQETGYDHRDENQLTVTRAYLAELQAKNDVLKAPPDVKAEEPQQKNRKTKHRSKKSKHTSKESSHSKRSSGKSL